MIDHLHILWSPLLPPEVLAMLALGAGLVVGYAVWRRSKGAALRGAAFALLLAALGNPSVVTEQRESIPDTALIVVDDSASMKLGNRAEQVRKAKEALTKQTPDNLKVETLHVTGREDTTLFRALGPKLAEMPRLAGIVLLTDGQVHDAPPNFEAQAPLHAVIAGHKGETDRRLSLVQAPAYGIAGKDLTVTLRVEDEPQAQGDTALVTLHRDDGTETTLTLPVGQDTPVTVPVNHPGPNLFAFTTPALPNELTLLNNSIAVSVNGIRDRLRVLLVSGEPHAGERVWRNFLKGDPAVDLVHFTILRSPFKPGPVPQSQLALIPFPVEELFQSKLPSFDLVIFDRFHQIGLIPASYLDRVARYVEKGGALLISDSTAEQVTQRLGASPLGRVLPLESLGTVLTGAFTPETTESGKRHPVTNTLPEGGHWLRQVAGTPREGAVVVMSGLQNQPLLALAHAGEGRVAQFMSDQFWLWARHYDGGGPQAELLRRTAHWLMKEPELDETALKARAEPTEEGWQIIATKQSLEDASRTLAVADPDGAKREATLAPSDQPGLLRATIPADKIGLYRLRDGERQSLVMVGANGAPEYGAMHATAAALEPRAKESGGKNLWLEDGLPTWRDLPLMRHNAYRITGSHAYPLWPAWLLLAVLLASVMLTWRREGN